MSKLFCYFYFIYSIWHVSSIIDDADMVQGTGGGGGSREEPTSTRPKTCRRPTRRGQRGQIFASLPGAGGAGWEERQWMESSPLRQSASTDHRPREEKTWLGRPSWSGCVREGRCVMINNASLQIVVLSRGM